VICSSCLDFNPTPAILLSTSISMLIHPSQASRGLPQCQVSLSRKLGTPCTSMRTMPLSGIRVTVFRPRTSCCSRLLWLSFKERQSVDLWTRTTRTYYSNFLCSARAGAFSETFLIRVRSDSDRCFSNHVSVRVCGREDHRNSKIMAPKTSKSLLWSCLELISHRHLPHWLEFSLT
jgi:hypothetical protein